jgi:selenocysteine lyase/cysteine desulfurase
VSVRARRWWGTRHRPAAAGPIDVEAVRGHFAFPQAGRIVTNNAASTQPPRELLALYRSLAPGYENVHRGQSTASQRALDGLAAIGGITIYGPRDPARRTSLAAFNLAGRDPMSVAGALNWAGVESRAGCHCATLAHHALGLDPPASCRLSFYFYNTPGEVDRAVAAVAAVAAGRLFAAPSRGERPHQPEVARWPDPVGSA